ncbi:MAG TPA: TonB-dependent receptor, partial [Bryobacteraceae bacterium]|nr:TonB-dependent receptor [Bryobacteraceae bacterium]
MRTSRQFFITAVCLAGLPLFGQTEIGGAGLNGTVSDPSGAVVASAKVTARSPETGLTRTSETNSAGLYTIRIPVGKYDLVVEAAGFKKAEFKGLTLAVGSVLTIDVALQVGAASESVDVSADAPVIETSRTSSSTGVSARSVADLPVNGRNFIDFTTLTPGVVKDPTRGGDLSFGGQRGPANSLLVDGADSNNLFYAQATGRTGFRPYAFSQDAVQEFQVNANSFPAEIGRASGGAINVITKSGTNQLHGSVFEFYRDRGMNANTFVNNRAGVRKSPYHFNQFGGSVGGPVRKDKVFFFLNYDEQKNQSTQIMAPNSLPSAALLPLFQQYLAAYPLGIQNRVALAKVDFNLSDRDRLSVRYNLSRYTGVNGENSGPSSAQEHTGNNEVNTDNIATVYTRTIGSAMVWESRFNFVRDNEPGYANATAPEVSILNGISFGRNNFSPRYTNTRAYQPTSNLTMVKGRHTVKFGVDFNFAKADNYFPGNFGGSYTYNSYQDFVDGNPLRFVQAFSGQGTTAPISHPNVNEWAFFAQDSWRINDRLTLSLG